MTDAQSNIKVSIDTTDALASIKALQRQISVFHTSMAKSGAAANAVTQQMQQSLINSLNATGKFSAQMKTIRTTTESFTNSLEKNKFSLGEYFRYAGGASKTFGRLFKSEFDTINKVARENVKDLQTQYIKLGRDANGSMKAISVRPLALDMNDLATKTMIASERQALLNQLLKQGSTNLLNFGKNTQWAGRQLMVGFTIPLITVGTQAAKTFMDMETQAIKFKKVYGDLFTAQGESQAALDGIKELGKEFTKYGVALSDTVGLAAEAAAAGFQGVDLERQTTAATRLSILGQIDKQKALETTISVQNAFGTSSDQLASSIDFLNAVENQTVVSLDDITTAIPKVAPVIKQLGGDVKDLAFFMTAMKEGGINASEGANALKSGLASMINPTGKAVDMLERFGINIKGIVENNRGDLKKTVVEFATALNQLDPLNRAQAIEQMFGKFQFARLSTLFANVTKEGSQAARVLDLAGSSVQDLASLSEKELGLTAESSMNKFKAAVENLKITLIPVGEQFLKAVTPILEFVSKILDKFNNLGDGTKKVIVTLTTIVAGLGPVLLMTFGLLANGLANIIKGFTTVKTLFNRTGEATGSLGQEVQYMTLEQRNAAAVAASLDQVHKNLAQTFTSEAAAVDALTNAYARAIAKQSQFGGAVIGRGGKPKKYAGGKPYVVGGSGNQDSEAAMLTPGETVIPADMSEKYGVLINGIIADNIPGHSKGVKSQKGVSKGKKVVLPGGMDASHFGVKKQMSGSDLIALFDDAEPAVKARVEGLVNKFKDGSERMFTVFDNQVIALFADVNRDLDKKGKVSKARLKENLIGEKFAPIRDIELQRQFENAGKSPEAFRLANQQLTEAFTKGLADLGDATEVTEKQVNELIEKAYKEVSKTNTDVAEAHAKMKKIYSVTEPDVDGVRGKRVALQKESYLNQKKGKKSYKNRMTALVGAENIPYNFNSEFNISPEALKKLEMTGDQAATVFKRMSDEAKLGLSKLKGDTDAFVKQFAIEANKIGTAYETAIKKSGLTDPYPASRDRQSPHALAAKDGADDAIAYSDAQEKQLTKTRKKRKKTQSGKKRRVSSRPQGPAPIGLEAPEGATMLNIVAPLTEQEKKKDRRQKQRTKLLGKTKAVGSKLGTRLGGGTALLGANMALSAMPDFAGKELVQSTMTGANMGMMFGPWGAAAGAAIGLVSSAIGNLIEKQKQHKAMNEAVFKSSADLATFFGNAVVDTEIKVGSFASSLGIVGNKAEALGKSFGYSNEELKTFVDLVASLPENNPLKDIVDGLANEDNPESIKKLAEAFVTTQVAIGQIKPEQAQKTLDLILASSGHADMVGSAFMNLKTQSEAVASSLKNASKNSVSLGTSLTQLVGAATNATSLAQLTLILDGIAASGISAAAALSSMYYAYLQVGNLEAAGAVQILKKVAGITAEESALVLTAVTKGFKAEVTAMTNAKKLAADAEKFLNDPKRWTSSNPGATTRDYQGEAKVTSLKKEIDLLKAKKKIIDDQIKKEQRISDELKKQNDYRAKQASLDKQIVEAKIRGNYIDAANLLQEKKNNTAEFNQGNKVSDLQLQSDALQDQIDKLQKSSDQVVSAVNATTSAVTAGASAVVSAIGSITFKGGDGSSKSKAIEIDTSKESLEAYVVSERPRNKEHGKTKGILKQNATKDIDAAAAWDDSSARFRFEQYVRSQNKEAIAALENEDDGIVIKAVGTDGKTYTYNVKKNGDFIRVSKGETAAPKPKGKANGGLIRGPGTGRSDSITASLGYAGGGQLRVSNGEFVVKAASVKNYGVGAMNAINNGTATVGANGGGTVYNINMPITSNSADARQVANEVMAKLKLELNKTNKTNKVGY